MKKHRNTKENSFFYVYLLLCVLFFHRFQSSIQHFQKKTAPISDVHRCVNYFHPIIINLFFFHSIFFINFQSLRKNVFFIYVHIKCLDDFKSLNTFLNIVIIFFLFCQVTMELSYVFIFLFN